MSETKTIINANLGLFLREFQEHVQLGWEVDENNPPNIWGIAYETGLVRTDKSIAALAARDPGAPPVKTRAEILAHAREVRAQRQAERREQGATND
jgi:hypothetical protein